MPVETFWQAWGTVIVIGCLWLIGGLALARLFGGMCRVGMGEDDECLESPPERPGGTINVSLKYIGRSKPMAADDDA